MLPQYLTYSDTGALTGLSANMSVDFSKNATERPEPCKAEIKGGSGFIQLYCQQMFRFKLLL